MKSIPNLIKRCYEKEKEEVLRRKVDKVMRRLLGKTTDTPSKYSYNSGKAKEK